MPRRRLTGFERELRSARRTLAKIESLDPSLDNRWVAGMVAYWRDRIAVLEAAARSERSAH